jgi:secreted trypsin-like serine protease
MRKVIVMLFACSMAACAIDVPDDGKVYALDDGTLVTSKQEVIGGVTDAGDPGVAGLFIHPPGVNSGQICTCTTWAQRTCLTACHCIDPRVVGTGPMVFDFFGGTQATLIGVQASSAVCDPQFDPANPFGGHDFAAVHTTNPLPFPPVPRGAVNLGLPARVVGYGSNTHQNTGVGTKRTVTTNIVAANALLIQVGNSNAQSCHGDSGGPVFQTINGQNTAVAVTSFGSDQSPTSVCFGGGFHARIDSATAWINANSF